MSRNKKPIHRMPLLRTLATLALTALLLTGCSEPEKPSINLYRAIHAGDLDQIKRHLYWDTDINAPGADGDYPLHVAARRGRVVIARELLEHGADLQVQDTAGHTPLEIALIEGKTQLAQVLIKAGAGENPQDLLFMLARSGVSDRDSLELVVKAGADVTAADDAGDTALHIAVSNGGLLVVKRLITLGADVNASDRDGQTPLAIATADDRRDIVALLGPFGARLETTTTPE